MSIALKDTLLDILFPKYCLGCGREGLYICKKCELFILEVNNFGSLTSFWEYNGIIKEAIHQIKYNGAYDIVRELVDKKDFEIEKDTIITYVPMYIKKQKKRGFNQAEIIAKEVGRKTGFLVVKMLEKIKETKDQAKLNREERLENLKDSFREARPLKKLRSLMRGRASILLVDDVYTSGATMEECSKGLRKAGVKNISYFTLARTI